MSLHIARFVTKINASKPDCSVNHFDISLPLFLAHSEWPTTFEPDLFIPENWKERATLGRMVQDWDPAKLLNSRLSCAHMLSSRYQGVMIPQKPAGIRSLTRCKTEILKWRNKKQQNLLWPLFSESIAQSVTTLPSLDPDWDCQYTKMRANPFLPLLHPIKFPTP